VVVYHNGFSIDRAKLLSVKPQADLPPLLVDGRPLTPREVFWRRLRNRLKPWIVR
jgi:hypothetical protein